MIGPNKKAQTKRDRFLHQTQIAGHISGRDIRKRLASALLMVGVCALAGFATKGAILFGCILLLELLAYRSNKRASQFDQPLGMRQAIYIFLINWIEMFPFLAFALVLSSSDQTVFIICAYLWAFGIYVHVSNTFGLLPFYNWSQMSVAFATIFVMLWNVSSNPVHASEISHWVTAIILTTAYIINTYDTMHLQRDTHDALDRARQEANARLAELERLSRSDSLTGLMNRRAFDEVTQSMMRQHSNKLGVTIFLIDLDGFKPINDSYGHEAGDAVLCAVAQRLSAMAGPDGRVARVGGDEFAVVSAAVQTTDMALEYAQSLITAVSRCVSYQQKELNVGASIGIARQRDEGNSLTELMSGADQAMYLAKQEPDTKMKIFDRGAFPVRPTLEDRQMLLDAMQNGQIIPHYQPKVSAQSGEIIGFEALSRWHHPTRGLLAPCHFLPMVNELALQGAFMVHTTEHVLQDLSAMVKDGLDPGQVSINISEVALATLVGRKDLFAVIDRYPELRPNLTFEITEDIFIARSSEIIRKSIVLFREAGVRISLDDFGTGYASLQHLKELEFDELKLDTGFVRDLGVDPAAKVLIEGIVTISRGLQVDLIAEGVETQKQLDTLRDMGCRLVQGYYFGQAMPFEEAYMRLAAQGDRSVARPTVQHPQASRAAS